MNPDRPWSKRKEKDGQALFDSCLWLFQHIPNFVTSIHTMGHRVVVGDIQDSFHFVRYRRQENQLIVFADDTLSLIHI